MFKYNCCSFLKTWLKKEIRFLFLCSNNRWSNKYLSVCLFFINCYFYKVHVHFLFFLSQTTCSSSELIFKKMKYCTTDVFFIKLLPSSNLFKRRVFTFHFHSTSSSSNIEYKYNHWIYLNMQYIFLKISLSSK